MSTEGEPDANALLNQIFGDSSDSEDEFEGFGEEAVEAVQPVVDTNRKRKKSSEPQPEEPQSDSDGEDRIVTEKDDGPFRKQIKKRKTLDEGDLQQDAMVKKVLSIMDGAAEQDIKACKNHEPAIFKLRFLDEVMNELRKAKLFGLFIENGLYSSIAAWLRPLPNRSLPNEKIRSAMISILESLPPLDKSDHEEYFNKSQIGNVCAYLYRNAKETPSNKKRLQMLMQNWSVALQRLSQHHEPEPLPRSQTAPRRKKKDDDNQSGLRFGDEGFIMRARVPQPMAMDFVARPVQTHIDIESRSGGSRRLEKLNSKYKKVKQGMRRGKQTSAQVSISGSRL